jgi:CheY-like chemotaxis protein
LLVEDNELIRPLVAEILEDYGYTVLAAASGSEAIALAGRPGATIDLLLTDVVMPRMTGWQLAEALRSIQPGLGVLFTSGYPADEVVRHGIERASVAFIQKPFLASELAAEVRSTLDREA